MKALRILSLAGYLIAELPSSIAGLKHLRLLSMSHSKIEMLPESLCELYNMQTLILFRCNRLVRLPNSMRNLINLHHLDIRGTDKLQEMPLRMGNLTNLSTLSKYIVGKDKGVGIGELKELSHLQREISIQRLDNVVNIEDAEDANLKNKHGLSKLSLMWTREFGGSRDRIREQEVLNALRPHQNIEELAIYNYAGTRFPSWVGDISFCNMVSVMLVDCGNVTLMPPLGGLPLLRDLEICGMDGIKEVGLEFYETRFSSSKPKVLFPSLEVLSITEMPNWEQWSDGLTGGTTTRFPNLREVRVKNCPKLVGMYPDCLPLLESLHIQDCKQLVEWSRMLPSLSALKIDGCNEMLLENVPNLSSLTHFQIESISGLEHLKKELTDSLGALEDLSIRHCGSLKHLWQHGTDLKKLGCLKSVEVNNCEEIVSLIDDGDEIMPRNLQKLKIFLCPNFEKLPSGLQSLTHLKLLEVTFSNKLTSLCGKEEETLPSSLEELQISSCDELERLPNGFTNLTSLSSLDISYCPKLEVFPVGGLPRSVTDLKISRCESLKEVPKGIMNHIDENIPSPHLRRLKIIDCPSLIIPPTGQISHSLEILSIENVLLGVVLRSSPNLTFLQHLFIWGFLENLTIEGADNLSALSNLTSLRILHISSCGMDSFGERGLPPNLTGLHIISCTNLKQPMSEWRLYRLTSLRVLEIWGPIPSTDPVVSFPHIQLPTSLTKVSIWEFENLKSVSSDIRRLTSLESLDIFLCPKLRFLPKSGLPLTLGSLRIKSCPLLKAKECIKKYVHIIANVPHININDCEIIAGKAISSS